jgi:8-oxo-dGTP pyrophosphatase MutT (NUDIX family)
MAFPVRDQRSAGGVVARERGGGGWEVALICVGAKRRWQLPKGIVEEGEPPESAALRETREEAGVEADLVAPLETVEYWYVGSERGGGRVRFHKRVHFYLMAYRAGDVGDHDHEVLEARWVEIAEAARMLAFPSERKVLRQAAELLGGTTERGSEGGQLPLLP